MTGILFLIQRIYCNVFRSNYLKKKAFSKFFVAFWKSRFNFERFLKKYDPRSWYIVELTDSEKRA